MQKIDSQYKSLVQYTKLSQKQQKQLINWFNRQNILIKIDIFTEQKNQFFKLKNEYKDSQVIALASFMLAIQFFYRIEVSKYTKNKKNDLSVGDTMNKRSIGKAKKERYKKKREKLLSLWSVILILRTDDDFSFREISDYLRGHHRFDVSHTYIHNIWKELENGN